MKEILPKDEREKMLCEYWKEQGMQHKNPSRETIDMFNEFKISLVEINNEFKLSLTEINSTLKTVNDTIKRLEIQYSDIESVKKWQTRIITGATVVWFVSGFVYYLFMSNLKFEINKMIDDKVNQSASTVKALIEPTARNVSKEIIYDFADKNFDKYNK